MKSVILVVERPGLYPGVRVGDRKFGWRATTYDLSGPQSQPDGSGSIFVDFPDGEILEFWSFNGREGQLQGFGLPWAHNRNDLAIACLCR
ncbi:MAG: hypothetical protein HOE86_27180 [Gemmatimonadetes bacterium]|nr:hypothetical protein [Gemmatimonadota bacterium]